MSISNNNGRALEARLVDIIIQRNPSIQPLGSTLNDQTRDLQHFNALSPLYQKEFSDFSNRYIQELSIHNIQSIERLKDTAAMQGDVTDIRLIYKDNTIRNISLKHNHDACKHQRPAALIKNQLGIQNQALDQQYRQELDLIYRNFSSLVLPQDKDENGNYLFKLVKERNPKLIEKLYTDVYQLVKKYLLNHTDPQSVQTYFKFLVGNTDFEKVTLYANHRKIVIKDFSSIADATKIIDADICPRTGYLTVKFDNNFILNMRIHTASSKFALGRSLSLKFDSSVDMDNAPVPQRIITY